MKKHFVTFLSPGTFLAEETTREITSWDAGEAVKLSNDIVEGYGAKPYGFYFTTRERGNNDFDSRETKRSGVYFLGGKILSLQEVQDEMRTEEILISNMKNNHIESVVVNNNSWRTVQPFRKGDTLIDMPVSSDGQALVDDTLPK